MDIFSNSIYMGTSEDGMPVRPTLGSDDRYHIQGVLELAPTSMLRNVWKTSEPPPHRGGLCQGLLHSTYSQIRATSVL